MIYIENRSFWGVTAETLGRWIVKLIVLELEVQGHYFTLLITFDEYFVVNEKTRIFAVMDADIKQTYSVLSKRLNSAIDRKNKLQSDLQEALVEVDALSNIIKGLLNLFGDELNIEQLPIVVKTDLDYSSMSFTDKVVAFLNTNKRVTIPQIEGFLLTQGELKVTGKTTLKKRITDALFRLKTAGRVANDGVIDGYAAYKLTKKPLIQ